ncbi:MAG: hypothetical protein HC836_30425 [Richelia sp. RM2_1_2]|nr:hypothetical protein [Richelia sp. RM2_1_2]
MIKSPWHYVKVPTKNIVEGHNTFLLKQDVYDWLFAYNVLSFPALIGVNNIRGEVGLIRINGPDSCACFYFKDNELALLFKLAWG